MDTPVVDSTPFQTESRMECRFRPRIADADSVPILLGPCAWAMTLHP